MFFFYSIQFPVNLNSLLFEEYDLFVVEIYTTLRIA